MNPPPAEGLASRLFVGPALRAQPDRRLVTLVRDGYESAFEEIVRRYGKPLGRYAAAIVGGRSEEVTQDAFSKALLALRRADGERDIELRPWLYRIVRNTALNDLRDRPPETAELREALTGSRSTAEEVERREEVSELLERLRALPEPQRAAIVMRELEGLGHEEIAAALGVSGGAARQAIYRARLALRDGLGLMIPLPLLRALIDHGAEAGSAAGAGGAIAAGSTIGGAGAAIKVGAITAAIVAGGVGTGIALKEHHHPAPAQTRAAAAQTVGEGASPSSVAADPPAPRLSDVSDASGDRGDGEQHGSGEGGGGEGSRDSFGRGDQVAGGGDSEHGQPPGSQQHGGGPGPPPQQDENGSGPGPSEGGQTQGGGSGDGGHGQSPNSGGGGGGTSGSGDKGERGRVPGGGGGGPGSGDQSSGGPPPPPPPPTQENGSSGSGSSGSGSSGSGSGGSGSSSGGSGSSSGGSGSGSGDGSGSGSGGSGSGNP